MLAKQVKMQNKIPYNHGAGHTESPFHAGQLSIHPRPVLQIVEIAKQKPRRAQCRPYGVGFPPRRTLYSLTTISKIVHFAKQTSIQACGRPYGVAFRRRRGLDSLKIASTNSRNCKTRTHASATPGIDLAPCAVLIRESRDPTALPQPIYYPQFGSARLSFGDAV